VAAKVAQQLFRVRAGKNGAAPIFENVSIAGQVRGFDPVLLTQPAREHLSFRYVRPHALRQRIAQYLKWRDERKGHLRKDGEMGDRNAVVIGQVTAQMERQLSLLFAGLSDPIIDPLAHSDGEAWRHPLRQMDRYLWVHPSALQVGKTALKCLNLFRSGNSRFGLKLPQELRRRIVAMIIIEALAGSLTHRRRIDIAVADPLPDDFSLDHSRYQCLHLLMLP
jgi:hypothetical protein